MSTELIHNGVLIAKISGNVILRIRRACPVDMIVRLRFAMGLTFSRVAIYEAIGNCYDANDPTTMLLILLHERMNPSQDDDEYRQVIEQTFDIRRRFLLRAVLGSSGC